MSAQGHVGRALRADCAVFARFITSPNNKKLAYHLPAFRLPLSIHRIELSRAIRDVLSPPVVGSRKIVSMSHLRHLFGNDFAAQRGATDAVALATTSCHGLLAYELDEGGYDAVELVVDARILLNVAAHDRDFQTGECF